MHSLRNKGVPGLTFGPLRVELLFDLQDAGGPRDFERSDVARDVSEL